MPQTQNKTLARNLGAGVLIVAAIGAYAAVAANTLRNAHTTFAEVGYLIRSWWYTADTLAPYTSTDATWQMPIFYYVLGWWQKVAGVGHAPARLMSSAAGLIGAGFLFATCRRLTGNVLAAAAGVLVFLATPATAYAFSMATPTALVSTLHLAAIWVLVMSLGRPRPLLTVVFALLCVGIVFTRENLLPGVLMLIPLYIAAIGRERSGHAAILFATIIVAVAALVFTFPSGLAADALRLPLIAPYLERWGVLPPDFGLIAQGTSGPAAILPGVATPRWMDLIDTLVLPFAGTIVLSLMVFVVTGKSLRVLWFAPLYFLALIAAHVIATASYCNGCMLTDTPTFAGVGALAAALGLAALASVARRNDVSPGLVIIAGGIFGAALNTFGPAMARSETYRYYPAPQLTQTLPQRELDEIDDLSRWLTATVPTLDPVLVLHDNPGVPYAVFLARATFPVQSIDPDGTHRIIKPRVTGATREAVQAAVEAQSLWTDATLQRWLDRDYELVLVAQANDRDQSATIAQLGQMFDVVGTHPFRGQTLTLYRRKTQQ